jgi:endonuclease/exonuclease/phosphatase family metal-dependent hydrolase
MTTFRSKRPLIQAKQGIALLLALSLTTMPLAAADADRISAPASADRPAGHAGHSGPLRVLTLNMAHGRNDAFNQMLLSADEVKDNLAGIAALLQRAKADVVALQEADGPSRWSGGFDHVALLSAQAGYPWYTRGSHAKSWLFDYGTAMMSRIPFASSGNHAFKPTPPSLTKGLSMGQIALMDDGKHDKTSIHIVSVHLDFSRESVRSRQIKELIAVLPDRSHPLIIVGDFNSDWLSTGSVVADLARRCKMQAFQPKAGNLGTYRSNGSRLDWILISDDLEFLSHSVLPDAVSDHHAVMADIGVKPKNAKQANDDRGMPRCTS